ncbi:MAG: chemotaxis protein CheX [Candidatus Omnitrophica bacterium]|nr:chemotaxis protein CheX [Candidatus Omnitrophota bacterium]
MAKEFDIQALNTTIIGVVEETFGRLLKVKFTSEPVAVQREIVEYNSRMRVFPMEKFNGPVYVSVINFYLSTPDLNAGKAIGTFVFFVKEDVADKLLKAFGVRLGESDNEDLLMDNCGEFCNILAGSIKNELANLGYVDLTLSAPSKYKSSIPEGVQFDYNLYQKQDISFSFWNQKCIAIEACMGQVPLKGK